jgi:hypothetical protein
MLPDYQNGGNNFIQISSLLFIAERDVLGRLMSTRNFIYVQIVQIQLYEYCLRKQRPLSCFLFCRNCNQNKTTMLLVLVLTSLISEEIYSSVTKSYI